MSRNGQITSISGLLVVQKQGENDEKKEYRNICTKEIGLYFARAITPFTSHHFQHP
jgi:hypothetical protein